MFRKLRQKMKRTDVVRVRGLLERLEERAMLSASHGSMAHGHPGPDFGPRMGTGSRFGDAAAVAPPRQQSVSYDTPMFSGGHEFGGSYHGLQSRPPMQTAFQSSPRPQVLEPRWSQSPSWNQSVASPPPPTFENSYSSEPEYVYYISQGPTYTVWEFYVVSVEPKIQETPKIESTIPVGFVAPPRSSALKAPLPVDLGFGNFDLANVANNLPAHNQLQASVSLDQVRNTIPSSVGVIAIGSTLTNSPAVSQVLSRETSTVAALTAVAREVAFQEFSSRLFQANATSAYSRANIDGLGREATQTEVLDGFIRPPDESITEDIANTSDAVVREREAVDAVLDGLHDLDTLLPTSTSTDVNFQIELQAETALDELPAGEVDGGMVLLQAVGNANESGFDLTPVYANHLERYDAPAKMETSVGMFQAVDVATDDAPLVEAASQSGSSSEFKAEIKLDDNLPTRREKTPSNKAAAIVGATTLTGALVWMSRNASRVNRPRPTAQKRRSSRS